MFIHGIYGGASLLTTIALLVFIVLCGIVGVSTRVLDFSRFEAEIGKQNSQFGCYYHDTQMFALKHASNVGQTPYLVMVSLEP